MPATNLKTTAYRGIKNMITDGRMLKNKVYSERKLCQDLGVSRTPLHAALLQLEQEGFIDILPSRGFCLHRITPGEVNETFEVRSAIEYYAVAKLADDLSKGLPEARSTVVLMEQDLEKQRAIARGSRSVSDFVDSDYAFHQTIVSYPGIKPFIELYNAHIYKIRDLAMASLAHEGRIDETVQEHQQMMDSLLDFDFERTYHAVMKHLLTPRPLIIGDLTQPAIH